MRRRFHFRYWPLADLGAAHGNVRFQGQSGPGAGWTECRLLTRSGVRQFNSGQATALFAQRKLSLFRVEQVISNNRREGSQITYEAFADATATAFAKAKQIGAANLGRVKDRDR